MTRETERDGNSRFGNRLEIPRVERRRPKEWKTLYTLYDRSADAGRGNMVQVILERNYPVFEDGTEGRPALTAKVFRRTPKGTQSMVMPLPDMLAMFQLVRKVDEDPGWASAIADEEAR